MQYVKDPHLAGESERAREEGSFKAFTTVQTVSWLLLMGSTRVLCESQPNSGMPGKCKLTSHYCSWKSPCNPAHVNANTHPLSEAQTPLWWDSWERNSWRTRWPNPTIRQNQQIQPFLFLYEDHSRVFIVY